MTLRSIIITLAVSLSCTLGIYAQGQSVTFNPNTRYSELVINSRINSFYANTTKMGFGQYNDQGEQIAAENGTKSALDYVPGLVAKAIIEAVEYYKDCKTVNVKPWYYAIRNYANKYDIASAGKDGKSFDDLNAVKLYFGLQKLISENAFAEGGAYTDNATKETISKRFAASLVGIKKADAQYAIAKETLPGAAGGWFHKSSYVNQMWCDGQYMGPALLAQMINEYDGYKSISSNDWDMITKQFTISWNYLWNEDTQLLYHAFTASPGDSYSLKWDGISSIPGKEIYHSAEYWGRAEGWYFLALVDVLEQMLNANLTSSTNYTTLRTYLNKIAKGLQARQDETGCWYQLLAHDGSYKPKQAYDSSYRYTSDIVDNYLESSATAIFIAAYLKGTRLGLYDEDYTQTAKKGYEGFVNQFMKEDGKGGVHLVRCCKSAGLGGSNYRDGSAAYYLMGKDTKPTSADPGSSDFYTEGKVFGAFVIAATEYERMFIDKTTGIVAVKEQPKANNSERYNLLGQKAVTSNIVIQNNKKYLSKL